MGKDFATSVLRASFLFWAGDSVAERTVSTTVSIVRSTKLTTTPRIPDNSTLSQEHVEISGRALPEMVGMLFKERTCGLPPLGTEHP